jgi:hypothetical protein
MLLVNHLFLTARTEIRLLRVPKSTEDEEVSDLHPPLLALAERADKVMPGAVVGASGPFDEKPDDEEQRTDGAPQASRSLSATGCSPIPFADVATVLFSLPCCT